VREVEQETDREPEEMTKLPGTTMQNSERILAILARAKTLAREYRALTGKPLGITGEVAEYEAARLLRLKLMPARTDGYDAIRPADGRRFEIKGRCLLPGHKPGQRIGKIDVKQKFDAVLLVLMDEKLDATAIYEASRRAVVAALIAPGSRSRIERGALGVNRFKRIGRCVWLRRVVA
jgi:hypothetical protein